ncbi:MAG: tetratricopeptide repeat protein [Candidatus Hodarchaeota archaeon]
MTVRKTTTAVVIGLLLLTSSGIIARDIEGAQTEADANEIKPTMGQFPSEIDFAMRCQARGEYDKAIQSYELAIEKHPNTVNAPIAYAGIGDCYRLQGQDGKAKEFYDRAKPLFEEIIAGGNTKEMDYYHACVRLAEIFSQLEDWSRAAHYWRLAAAPEVSAPLTAVVRGGYFMGLGKAYEKQEKWRDAVSAYNQALEYFTKAKGPPPLSNIAATHSWLAECYIELRNWEAAKKELQKRIYTAEIFLKDNPDLRESRRKSISEAIEATRTKIGEIEVMGKSGISYLITVVVGIVVIIIAAFSLLLIKKERKHAD